MICGWMPKEWDLVVTFLLNPKQRAYLHPQGQGHRIVIQGQTLPCPSTLKCGTICQVVPTRPTTRLHAPLCVGAHRTNTPPPPPGRRHSLGCFTKIDVLCTAHTKLYLLWACPHKKPFTLPVSVLNNAKSNRARGPVLSRSSRSAPWSLAQCHNGRPSSAMDWGYCISVHHLVSSQPLTAILLRHVPSCILQSVQHHNISLGLDVLKRLPHTRTPPFAAMGVPSI